VTVRGDVERGSEKTTPPWRVAAAVIKAWMASADTAVSRRLGGGGGEGAVFSGTCDNIVAENRIVHTNSEEFWTHGMAHLSSETKKNDTRVEPLRDALLEKVNHI